MKTLIVYGSKTGAAKKYAELLAQKMDDCTLADIRSGVPNLSEFDLIIAGSGVRVGKAYKPMRNFLAQELSTLLEKQVAIYLCCGEPKTFSQSAENSIPQELQASALCVSCFRGTVPFKKADSDSAWMDKGAVDAFLAAITKG